MLDDIRIPQLADDALLRDAFDGCPLLPVQGKKFVINSLTEQIPATRPDVLARAAEAVIEMGDFQRSTKIVGEEDKGAVLIAAVSLKSGLPFGIARWYPNGLDGQISVPFDCEYHSGSLFLNGVERGDMVIIVDDMLSTGGTLIGLIRAVEAAGAIIVDIVCLAEKIDYGGAARVESETGYTVKSVVKLSLTGERSTVVAMF
ncbi:phosphoribosyltransferase family protein [Trinickia diaoshuihuensis]|jgi:adenine/guanine phosphoribosyltransferase-like PRPP-binding protein|uniref:phosphoribosyltransferase family protein n=1 Tax=Trinickia diaoshuihuensis TaxID=2292265 RepID=UPI000E25A477|nr:phosphoribosyltransferase family protein [Trinickia diaoshuihuensis]